MLMNKTLAFLIVTLLTASAIPLNASADATQDIPANAVATGIHDSLVAALGHVDLVTTLQGPGPFTVFAPTDQAFADAGIDLSNFNTDEEKATLTDILLHHVFAGEVASADVSDGMIATMVNGDDVKFSVSNSGTVSIGPAAVTLADALSGTAEAVRRVTIKDAIVLFMTFRNLCIGYNRLFFFNTSNRLCGKMKTSVQGHEEIELRNIL